jgi:uncharacterized circularly permuted ATP-grasp superfamily protein
MRGTRNRKNFPFDIIPRILTKNEWTEVETGITQRLRALNLFLGDIYNEQLIVKEGIIPAALITSCPHYLPEVHGIKVMTFMFILQVSI